MQGSFKTLANSDDLYAQLLVEEQQPTEDEKANAFNAMKTMRQQSVRVSDNILFVVFRVQNE